MQTFLPYPGFSESAAVLDRQRLGKQRVEALQILCTLQGKSSGWMNHPAVRMWKGYEPALTLYGWVMCDEWLRRGYVDNYRSEFGAAIYAPVLIYPPWLGDEAFHRSHQSNLVRKMPAYYRPLFPDVPDDLPYVWPIKGGYMSDRCEGRCIGGPHDGQMMAHWSRTKKYFKPMVAFALMRNVENEVVEPVEIGEYRLNDYGQWHWWATAQGKAYEVLFRGQ